MRDIKVDDMVYQDNMINVAEASSSHDYILFVENRTNKDIVVNFQNEQGNLSPLEVPANDIIGLPVNDEGRACFDAFLDNNFEVDIPSLDKDIGSESFDVEHETDGWWRGRLHVDESSLTEEQYEAFFDHEEFSIPLNVANTILEARQQGDKEECVPGDELNEFAIEQIKEQVMEGNMWGTIFADGEELNWNWEPEITLDGEEVDFQDDLSDASKEHIVDGMLNDGWHQGEVNEVINTTQIVTVAEPFMDGNGIYQGTIDVEDYYSDNAEVFSYKFGPETKEVDIKDPSPLLNEFIDEVKDTISECVSDYLGEPALDEMVQSAEEKAEKQDVGTKDIKQKDEPEL